MAFCIGGGTPDSEFKPYTPEHLTEEVERQKANCEIANSKAELLLSKNKKLKKKIEKLETYNMNLQDIINGLQADKEVLELELEEYK